jgi:hypothetical protein
MRISVGWGIILLGALFLLSYRHHKATGAWV